MSVPDDGRCTQGERVVFRKRALAGERGHDRDVSKLRELDEVVGRFGVQHTLPRVDHRVVGGEQRRNEVADVLGACPRLERLHGLVVLD